MEETCYKTMEMAIDHVNRKFTPMMKTLSPNIASVQMHLDVFDERNRNDTKLATNGILNYNLCLNAETEQAHTECDSSYTIICVPNQIERKARSGYKNCGSFEFIVNSNCTITVPMYVGTILVYSGFLLTHRQQIRNKDAQFPPFVNMVTYNSKRMFENVMESFRRYLDNH